MQHIKDKKFHPKATQNHAEIIFRMNKNLSPRTGKRHQVKTIQCVQRQVSGSSLNSAWTRGMNLGMRDYMIVDFMYVMLLTILYGIEDHKGLSVKA